MTANRHASRGRDLARVLGLMLAFGLSVLVLAFFASMACDTADSCGPTRDSVKDLQVLTEDHLSAPSSSQLSYRTQACSANRSAPAVSTRIYGSNAELTEVVQYFAAALGQSGWTRLPGATHATLASDGTSRITVDWVSAGPRGQRRFELRIQQPPTQWVGQDPSTSSVDETTPLANAESFTLAYATELSGT